MTKNYIYKASGFQRAKQIRYQQIKTTRFLSYERAGCAITPFLHHSVMEPYRTTWCYMYLEVFETQAIEGYMKPHKSTWTYEIRSVSYDTEFHQALFCPDICNQSATKNT